MKRIVLAVATVAALAIAANALAAHQPTVPPNGTFSARACIDAANVVHTVATWSKAEVDQITWTASGFFAPTNGEFVLGVRLLTIDPPSRAGNGQGVDWLPDGTAIMGIPTDQMQATFHGTKGWETDFGPFAVTSC
jgi:hypothetical protein